MKREVLWMDRVSTEDPELTDLDNMTMRVFDGEIAGLLATDEQGKKKLLEIIRHNVPLRYGRVYIDGEVVNSYLKSDYSFNRVCIISQKNCLIPDLTVADNLFVLRKGFRQHILDEKLLNQQTQRILEHAGIEIAPDTLVSELTVFERISIELVKAVVQRSRLIVFDEISSVLSARDVLRLRDTMQYYAEQGLSFLYMGNHHEEIMALCDRVMIMQYGRISKNIYDTATPDKDIIQIAGTTGLLERYLQIMDPSEGELKQERAALTKSAVLEFCNVTGVYLKNLSFAVQPGECIALLDRSTPPVEDIMDILTGQNREWSGEIICAGKHFVHTHKIQLLDDSIGIIQEYAHRSMIFPHLTFMENLCVMSDRKINNVFLQNRVRKSVRKEYRNVFGSVMDETDMRHVPKEIKYTLVYYRYLMLNPKVVFCIQPFSGADMRLRMHIQELIYRLKARGIAVVIVTAGLTDAHYVSDRILMMEKGSMVYEFKKEEFRYLWDDLLKNQ